jgi:hypothetical protein
MQPCAPAPLPGIPAQSAVTCILSVTTVGPIPLQPWSALGLHLVRTRASCIRHTEALAHTLLKRMPTETAGNRVRPHHAHYARGASGCARRSPKRARGAGRHAPTTCQRARRACALASRVSWRFCSHTRSCSSRQRAVAGLRGSRACEAPTRQAVRAVLHTLLPCASAVYQQRAQARQSGCAGFQKQGLTRTTKAYAIVRQPSTAPQRHTSAPILGRRLAGSRSGTRGGRHSRFAGWGGCSPTAQLRTTPPVRRDSPAACGA